MQKRLSKTAARAKISEIEKMVVRANAIKAVAGLIPQSILDSIESALNIVVPMTAFLGDFELTTLLSGLKVWLQKKRLEAQQEDALRNSMNDIGYSDYWSSPW